MEDIYAELFVRMCKRTEIAELACYRNKFKIRQVNRGAIWPDVIEFVEPTCSLSLFVLWLQFGNIRIICYSKLLSERLTILRLVLLRMVELLDSIVRLNAWVHLWTGLLVKLAKFWGIRTQSPSSVLIMVVDAFLLIMLLVQSACLSLEEVEIKYCNPLLLLFYPWNFRF